jgi:hypothetical protein
MKRLSPINEADAVALQRARQTHVREIRRGGNQVAGFEEGVVQAAGQLARCLAHVAAADIEPGGDQWCATELRALPRAAQPELEVLGSTSGGVCLALHLKLPAKSKMGM